MNKKSRCTTSNRWPSSLSAPAQECFITLIGQHAGTSRGICRGQLDVGARLGTYVLLLVGMCT